MRVARLVAGMAILAFLSAAPARATVVTSLPDGTLVPIPVVQFVDTFGPGPHVFGPSITWTSTEGSSVFGWTTGYGFGGNGFWNGLLGPMAGLNADTGTMTFQLASPALGIGGFIDYAPSTERTSFIAIYDTGFILLESFDLTFTKGFSSTNAGEFLGFVREKPEIGYFTVSNNFVGITELTLQNDSSSVPEPGTLLLLGAGIVALATRRRRG